MSTTSEMHGSLKFPRRVPAKLPQKPSFSQTCSLLSQYLKEKRTSEIFRPTAAPMSIFPVPETKSMDLLGVLGSQKEDVTTDSDEAGVPTSAPPSMTIFYGGQVLVFDDLSPEKAKEIMDLATKGNSAVISAAGTSIIQQRQADLPIARRNSLHRFLEKRKDRVAAKSSQYAAPEKSSKPAEKSWLTLAA